MSCDKLVFDLSQEVEGSPNVFIRKDWINILDNQNQNYQNNQSIIDTSQLANSNKYMSYREAYLSIPLTLTLVVPANSGNTVALTPVAGIGNADYSIGLKNWYGQLIHSMTLDYNGTTIVQQTPFCNMWNSFKLMTSLSYNDVMTMGSTIGFYPDTAGSSVYYDTNGSYGLGASTNGAYVCENDLGRIENSFGSLVSSQSNVYSQLSVAGLVGGGTYGGNYGLTKRISWINYNPLISAQSNNGPYNTVTPTYTQVGITGASANQIWKSYIYRQVNSVAAGANGVMQIAVMATIYLKHIHSFFNMCPLLKGVFMKLTMNLNNSTTQVNLSNAANTPLVTAYTCNTFVGGVNPLLIPSQQTGSINSMASPTAGAARINYYNLSVGAVCTDATVVAQTAGAGALAGAPLSKSVYLYVPAYTFNPTFEQAYLSNNIKQIKYTDIYQYQVLGVGGVAQSGQFNNLITNGIANIKSVLIIPFYASTSDVVGPNNYLEFQSPFDIAGCCGTAPLVAIGNFNIQISGQNAIYNMQRYSFEEWNNQLYGQNAVNGGLTDGLTSGLIDFDAFQKTSCYYYVNVERMLPVEQSVPKSVQILGTNYCTKPLNLWVFIEYGVQVSIDVLTGARV